jgi:RTX calcium-binding nonapeptide repeat (4 copies)
MPDFFAGNRIGATEQVRASTQGEFVSSSPRSAIASLEGGGYVVIYEGGPLQARIYDSNGEAVGEPIALPGTVVPDVVGLPGGGFAVTWINANRVEAQLFDAQGVATTSVFSVGSSTLPQSDPDVTVLENGNIVFVWSLNPTSAGIRSSIRGQVFNASGQAESDELIVVQNSTLNSFLPEVTALSDGGFVVGWGNGTPGAFRDTLAQAFTSTGTPRGGLVTAPGPGNEAYSARDGVVAGLPDGNYLFAWTEVTVNDAGTALEARAMWVRVTPEGSLIGVPAQLGTRQFDAGEPDIAVRADGSFIITWRSDVPSPDGQSGTSNIGDIRAQLFAADGTAIGEAFTVNNVQDRGQLTPAIATFGSDDFAIIWQNHRSEFDQSQNVQLRNFYSVTSADDASNVIAGSAGVDFIRALGGADLVTGGLGNDVLDGGSNVDTAIVSGNRSAYTITQTSTGVFQVVGADGTDTLTGVEFLQFDDQILRLRPGTGVSVNFETADPSVYQSALDALRDFDGNALGGNGSWLRIGSADVNGDGDIDQIIVNRALGRFATVGTAPDGLVYFSDHGWAGETRVAGIYIDPLVAAGLAQAGGPTDSQRRFQNDLQIENINRVLGANDYDRDGGQEVFFALTDGTAYLRALMHADGNIRFADYLSQQQVIDYLTANGFGPETYAGWFPNPSSGDASFDAAQDSSARAALAIEGADITALPGAAGGELAFNPLGFAASPIMNEYLTAEFYG